ncbi:alpha/beta fold hydrolase [Polynucleobacter yangtzensis]|uniref:Lipase n=1 Tax=Polynucleobacter yangtzensis TaxID=1743159 RepID=A0ABN6TT92_9BURK|nr:alpha/beta hydrolase [Polynucleobacter yangtzensis]BDT79746.1 lipase [Polynucleobacter yangtzensis]
MNRIFLKFFYLFVAIFLFIDGVGAQTVSGTCNIEVKTIPIGGGTVEYLKVGKGTPILLLHGLFAQKEQWSELACYLSAAGYLVFAPDLPGYGKSAPFPIVDYKLENQVRLLHEFTNALNIQKLDLAGSSMGGAIASMYARAYPMQVRSLAFIGSPLGISGWSTQVKSALYQGINPFIPISVDQLNLENQLLFYKPPVVPESLQQSLIADYQKSNRHYQQVWDIVNLYLYEIEKNPPSPIPTLILWGKQDRIFDVVDIQRLRQKYPKNRYLVINEAGHLLMLETPKEVATNYIEFLKSK